MKGVAYIGALEVLEEKGILGQIERIGGTSAGAINAVLLALGYTREEMLPILLDLKFKNFLDDTWGIIPNIERLIKDYGWYKGDYFQKWIGKRIEAMQGVIAGEMPEIAVGSHCKTPYACPLFAHCHAFTACDRYNSFNIL